MRLGCDTLQPQGVCGSFSRAFRAHDDRWLLQAACVVVCADFRFCFAGGHVKLGQQEDASQFNLTLLRQVTCDVCLVTSVARFGGVHFFAFCRSSLHVIYTSDFHLQTPRERLRCLEGCRPNLLLKPCTRSRRSYIQVMAFSNIVLSAISLSIFNVRLITSDPFFLLILSRFSIALTPCAQGIIHWTVPPDHPFGSGEHGNDATRP